MKSKRSRFFLAFLMVFSFASVCFGKGAKILVNHIGYDISAGKRAVILGHQGDAFEVFKVKDRGSGREVFSGALKYVGQVRKWKDWHFWTADFDGINQEGVYYIECSSAKGSFHSSPFLIQKNILERNTLSDIIYYFKGQRCSGLLDKADRRMRFEGKDGLVDVHGGWFDATGDYGKHLSHLSFSTFFNPQQIPLFLRSLFRRID